MLDVVVRTQDGERHVRASAEELARLVRRIGGAGDEWVALQRIPDRPDVFAQVRHQFGGVYTVEFSDRGGKRQFRTITVLPEVAIAALVAWARQEPRDRRLSWTRLRPATPKVPPLDLTRAERAELEKELRAELVAGYTTRGELFRVAREFEGSRPVSRDQAWALVDRLWLQRVSEQAKWQGETDPERVTRAFTALQHAGITAREYFSCCATCGGAEIYDEAGPDDRGFVYFHVQCPGIAADGFGLALFFGGFDDSDETDAAIGHEVAAALEAVGLPVEWDRDPGQAIVVKPIDWRRRLIG